MPREVTLTDVVPRITLNVDPAASNGAGEVVRVTITYTIIDSNGDVYQQGNAKFDSDDPEFNQLRTLFRSPIRTVLEKMRQRAGVST